MSDFETVLERLLLDAAFTAALAADPGRALAGYDLTDDERDVLMAQVSGDVGTSMRMEERTSKAALFGLLGAAAELFAPTGLSHLDPADVAPPDVKDREWVQHLHRQDGAVDAAPINVDATSEKDFYHGLVTEMDIPADDGASKDPAYISLKWGETPRADGPFTEPTAGDGPKPPPEDLKPAPVDVKPEPPEDIKLAPVDIKLDPAIKMAPEAFDPPAPIHDGALAEPDLPVGIKMAPVDLKSAAGPELPHK